MADSLAAEARMAGMLPRGTASGLTLTFNPLAGGNGLREDWSGVRAVWLP